MIPERGFRDMKESVFPYFRERSINSDVFENMQEAITLQARQFLARLRRLPLLT
jgi:hypothetical protein